MNNEKRGYIIIAIIVIVFMIVDFKIRNAPYAYTEKTMIDLANNSIVTDNVGVITKDTVVEQTFLCTENVITSIVLYPGNYCRINKGILNVKLVECESDTVIKRWEYNVSHIVSDNAIVLGYNFFEKDNNINMDGKVYKIIISGEKLENDTILTLFKTMDKNPYVNSELRVNNAIQEGVLIFKVNSVSDKVYFRMVPFLIYIYILSGLEFGWGIYIHHIA